MVCALMASPPPPPATGAARSGPAAARRLRRQDAWRRPACRKRPPCSRLPQMVKAPASFISSNPRAPSSPMPVSSMPTALGPATRASDWNRKLAARTLRGKRRIGVKLQKIARPEHQMPVAGRGVDCSGLRDLIVFSDLDAQFRLPAQPGGKPLHELRPHVLDQQDGAGKDFGSAPRRTAGACGRPWRRRFHDVRFFAVRQTLGQMTRRSAAAWRLPRCADHRHFALCRAGSRSCRRWLRRPWRSQARWVSPRR